MRAVYPGSFDPPTVAHLAIVEAALKHVDEVMLVLSADPLGKGLGHVPVARRAELLGVITADRNDVGVAVSTAGLLVDIAAEAGATALVMGADKWAQVIDARWYGSPDARDAALRRLPTVLLAERAGATFAAAPVPVEVVVLDVDPAHRAVSATRARAGESDLMAEEARRSGLWR